MASSIRHAAFRVLACLVIILASSCEKRELTYRIDLEKVPEGLAQFRQVETAALGGSTQSTDDLIQFYSRCYKRSGFTIERDRECRSRFEYWVKVGLENGSPVAAQRQAASIMQSDSCYDIYRAEYLYSKFRKSFESSPDFLKSASEEISEKKKTCTWRIPNESADR